MKNYLTQGAVQTYKGQLTCSSSPSESGTVRIHTPIRKITKASVLTTTPCHLHCGMSGPHPLPLPSNNPEGSLPIPGLSLLEGNRRNLGLPAATPWLRPTLPHSGYCLVFGGPSRVHSQGDLSTELHVFHFISPPTSAKKKKIQRDFPLFLKQWLMGTFFLN